MGDGRNRVNTKHEILSQRKTKRTVYRKSKRNHAIIVGEHIHTKVSAQQKEKNAENAAN